MVTTLMSLMLVLVSVADTGYQQGDTLIGAWQSVDNPEHIFRFTDEGVVLYYRGGQYYWPVEHGEDSFSRSDVTGWSGTTEYTFQDDRLHVDLKMMQGAFQRLPDIPFELRIEPIALGESTPDAAEIERIAAELQQRRDAEQAVRKTMTELMQAQEGGSPANSKEMENVQSRMSAIDQENRRWLVDTIKRVGWIDVERFGTDAANAAFLITQHSQYLPLQRAALPEILKDVQAGHIPGSNYALLYDRTMLKLQKKQRFGSQVRMVNGELWLRPLEDPENVDAYRAAMGLQPLDEYLGSIEETYNSTIRRHTGDQ